MSTLHIQKKVDLTSWLPRHRRRTFIQFEHSAFEFHCHSIHYQFPSKMSLNVLITGATGLLGRQMFNTFKHSGCLTVGQGFSRATPPTILKTDLENGEDVKAMLDEAK